MTRIIIGCFFRPFEAFVGHCPKFVGSSHRAVGRQLSLSGNSFNPCSQGTHDIGDASPGARFITAEILGRHRVVAFRSLQSARAFFSGKRGNELNYSWNCGKCQLQKAFLLWTPQRSHSGHSHGLRRKQTSSRFLRRR